MDKVMAISCGMKWKSFSYQRGTKESQKHPAKSHELASNFVMDARQTFTVPNKQHNFILNMDQTLIPFSLHGKWILCSYGTHTVDIHKSTGNTRYATHAVKVTAFGKMFPPFLMFKGRPGGQIEQEFC